MAKLCIICHKNPAVVPDRERLGRPIKAVCSICHGARLLGDLNKILRRDVSEPQLSH